MIYTLKSLASRREGNERAFAFSFDGYVTVKDTRTSMWSSREHVAELVRAVAQLLLSLRL
jgi:hypothetical protein